MKSSLIKFFTSILILIKTITFSVAEEYFVFNVTNIEITENGNLVTGTKGGKVTTTDGFEILGNSFVYDKSSNILNITGNIKMVDLNENIIIFSDKATYLKNEEIIFTEGNSKALDGSNIITASNFKFDKIKNILSAEKKVKFLDQEKETEIFSDKATYLKNEEIIFTEGKTSALMEKKYKFLSSNVKYLKRQEKILSNERSSIIVEKGNSYS